MSALGGFVRRALLVTVAVAGALAGCKDKESLVIVKLTIAATDTTAVTTASVSVGGHAESFPVTNGALAAGVSFGVYVPSSIKGSNQPINVTASPDSGCEGETGMSSVDIPTVGETYGPIPIMLTPGTACATGGSSGTGTGGNAGTTGTGGTATGGTGGHAGSTGTGGTGGAGGHAGSAGTGGTGGHAGSTGSGGTGGHAGSTGTGGTGTGGTGTGGTGTGGTGTGGTNSTGDPINSCIEYDHNGAGNCNMASLACPADTSIFGVAFSPKNPNLMVSGGSDGRTKVWTVSNGTLVAEGHVVSSSGYSIVAFSPDGTLLAIGGSGGVQLVSVTNWTVVRTLIVTNTVYGVAFSPDGTQVISLDNDGSAGGNLYVHAVTNVTPLHTTAVIDGWTMAVAPALSGGALTVAVGATDGSASIYSLSSAGFSAPVEVPAVASGSTYAQVAISPNGALFALGGNDGLVHFWNVPPSGAPVGPAIDVFSDTQVSSTVMAVAFSPDSSTLAVAAGAQGSATTWLTSTRKQIGTELDEGNGYDLASITYSPDGKLVAAGTLDCGCVALCTR